MRSILKRKLAAEPASTVIDRYARQQIERRRLLRIFESISREPTELELERLQSLVKTLQPRAEPGKYFVGMHAVTLMHENKHMLDLTGYASLKADGVHCHLARVNLKTFTPADPNTGEVVEEAAPPIERTDAVLFITRDNRVRAVDRVLLHNENKRVMLDGELCLRKIHLSEEERLRINSAHNVHYKDYLEYFADADEQAAAAGIDVQSDEHQRRYDEHYELVYAAFDCMVVHTRQVSRSYLQRTTLLHNMTESSITQDTTAAFRRRMDAVRRAVAYAGGDDQFQLTVFLKPMWSVKDIRAAMHAVPACMQGIATDGVVFNPNDSAYEPGASNARLLKFKVHHTADFAVQHTGSNCFELYVQESDGQLAVVSHNLLTDTPAARALVRRHVPTGTGVPRMRCILECEGVRHTGGDDDDGALWWRPVQHRSEKKKPNSRQNYDGVLMALSNVLDEEALIDYVVRKLRGGDAPLPATTN